MRTTLLATIAVAGLTFAAAPAALAAPIYGAASANTAARIDPIQEARVIVKKKVVVVRRGHRCWWRHGVRVCRR